MAKVRRAQITWKGDTGQTYTLTLDASVHESHLGTSTVTDHPVERGSNVSDHIRPDPDQLTIEGMISNTPHFLPVDHMGGVLLEETQIRGAQSTVSREVNATPFASGAVGLTAGFLPLSTGALGQIPVQKFDVAVAQGFTAAFDRVTECYKELLLIRSEGRLVRILTTLRSYDNMALTSLEVTREARTGNSLALSLAFKNVRFGATKNEPVPKLPVKAAEKGTKTKKEDVHKTEDSSSLLNLWLNKGR
jgi:Dit-like phage tail protein